MDRIRRYDASPKKDAECERQAIDLIDMDHMQQEVDEGQRVSEAFHLGDVFFDGIKPSDQAFSVRRFVNAFFGENAASPTKDEYGMYSAAAASLRSVDLSRQVGAAIFSCRCDVISIGCNEVPKALGGSYWTDDKMPTFRDVDLGEDANYARRREILFDLIDRLIKERIIRGQSDEPSAINALIDVLLSRRRIKQSQLMDILEFGRMIHAEMAAITDAARLGRSIERATLFCTAFPCHMCAKHIVASGISRVVFLEPYPKSYALKLHSDFITFDKRDTEKVLFEPFMGIAPRRYRDIFEKNVRKDAKGKALKWYEETAAPLIEDRSGAYIENEYPAVYESLGELYAPQAASS